MCILADTVDDVSKTKIVSFHVAYAINQGTTLTPAQLVMYSANVTSNVNSNALILPVYNPGNDVTKIIPLDLSSLTSIIDDIANKFEKWYPKQRMYSLSNSFGPKDSWNSESLQVFTVGDYKFSIMPSKVDFGRLDRSQLNINQNAKVSIDVHSQDYSFIVYQFYQKGKLEVTPFGYLCPSNTQNSMILPTIHGHPHDIFTSSIGSNPLKNVFVNYKSNFENESDFDHEIYTLVKSPIENSSVNAQDVKDLDRIIRKINTDYMKHTIRIYLPLNFMPKKITISGRKLNRNLYIDLHNDRFITDLTVDTRI